MGEFNHLLADFHEAQERGEVKTAEAIAVQCLSLAAMEQAMNPSECLRLVEEAGEHENAARWEQAEVTRRRILALAEAEGNSAMISKAHSDLGRLYTICERSNDAFAEAQAATTAANKSDIASLQLVALVDLAQCYLRNGDIAAATAAAEATVQMTPSEKMYDGQRARALLLRARCRIEQHRVAEAQDDLAIAWQLLTPLAEAKLFAGPQGSLAIWWEMTARIKTEAGNLMAAAQAMAQAVEFRRVVAGLPQLDGPHKHFWLAHALRQYGVALQAVGQPEAAKQALDESHLIYRKISVKMPEGLAG